MVDDKKLSQADADSAAELIWLVAWMIPIKELAMTTSIRLTLMLLLKKLRKLMAWVRWNRKNGYKIHTEMDANSQANMQQTYENTHLFPTSESDGSTAQSASVALDPTTGAVRGHQ